MTVKTDKPRLDIDHLQTVIIRRAAELSLSEQQLADSSGVPIEHVHNYLVRQSTMNSFKVAKLLKALKLKVVPDDASAEPPAV